MLATERSYTTVAATKRRDTVREEIKSCTRCMFAYNGNGPVLPSGPVPNDIMILGEAPTRTDDRHGFITFKGDPGLLLRRVLARHQIDLDRVFFVNAIQCWPEGDIPERNQLACLPNLRQLLAICDPMIVLALGAQALKVTSDRKGRTVTKNHGQPFLAQAGPFIDRWVFPTWHPAALKHTASAETAFSADIAAFADLYRKMREECHAG